MADFEVSRGVKCSKNIWLKQDFFILLFNMRMGDYSRISDLFFVRIGNSDIFFKLLIFSLEFLLSMLYLQCPLAALTRASISGDIEDDTNGDDSFLKFFEIAKFFEIETNFLFLEFGGLRPNDSSSFFPNIFRVLQSSSGLSSSLIWLYDSVRRLFWSSNLLFFDSECKKFLVLFESVLLLS